MSEKRIESARRIGRRCKGMTFTEVLIATAILAFAMVPVLQAMTRNHVYSMHLEQKSKSLLFARNQIEELRARAIENYDSSWSGSDLSLGDGYYCTVASDSDPSLRTVTVTAGFDADQDFHLDSEEVLITLRTFIARLQ